MNSAMDWKILFGTFVTIFLAELGDKTQIATLAASAQASSRLEIWLGVVLALTLAGTLGVAAGKFLGSFLTPATLRYVSGALFLAIGIWVLLGKPE